MNYLLKTSPARKEITTKSGGSTRYNVGQASLSEVFVNCPSLPEQQKIASFLSAVDDKVQQLTKKKELLEDYKKGVMQQLFAGQLRFKAEDGKDYPDWEEKRLGDLCLRAQSGGTPKSTTKEYYEGKIPFLAISDMTKQGKYLTYTSKKISQLGIDNSSSWLVPKESLIYSMYASVGFVAINMIDMATSQAVMNMILKKEEQQEFIYYYLNEFRRIIHKYIETGTQGNINAQIVKSIKIPYPVVEEQQKIATYLSGIDTKIEAVNNQITQNQTFKKGLLQQMFV
jgi:type I restriction enzyme S subunit